MARETNAMVTYNDAKLMVSIDGFSQFKPIPTSDQCMTKAKLKEYLDCIIEDNSGGADNNLISYDRIYKPSEPTIKTFLSSIDGFSSSALCCSEANTQITRYYEGVGAYPAFGETVYRDNNYNVFVGLNLWYFTLSGFSIKINNSGVIRDVQSCE
jgi:hypothetical protein